jgi:hypothetical protein
MSTALFTFCFSASTPLPKTVIYRIEHLPIISDFSWYISHTDASFVVVERKLRVSRLIPARNTGITHTLSDNR